MFRSIVFLFSCLASAMAFGQATDDLKLRCEKIIVNHIKQKGEDYTSALHLYDLRLVRLEQARDLLLERLESDDVQRRLVAAELLAEKSPMQFQQEIALAVEKVKSTKSTDIVHRSVILMKLGDKNAKREVQRWAKHEFTKIDLGDWECPMECAEPSKHAGTCVVCGMKQVKRTRSPNYDDWAATVFALQALQESGEKVAESARSIVVSNAPAFWRLRAAGLWANEDSKAALPHIKIFMDSGNQNSALSLLVEHAANESIAEFKQVIADSKSWRLIVDC